MRDKTYPARGRRRLPAAPTGRMMIDLSTFLFLVGNQPSSPINQPFRPIDLPIPSIHPIPSSMHAVLLDSFSPIQSHSSRPIQSACRDGTDYPSRPETVPSRPDTAVPLPIPSRHSVPFPNQVPNPNSFDLWLRNPHQPIDAQPIRLPTIGTRPIPVPICL